MNPERKAFIDKVQKLLAMADSTTHAAEAQAFRDKAADLMAKQAISEHELHGTMATYEIRTYEEDHSYDTVIMNNAVARFTGILLMTVKNRLTKTTALRVVGTTADIEAYEYMVDCVQRQCATEYIRFTDEIAAAGRPFTAKDRTKFFNGFAVGLNNKVSDLLAARDSKIQEWGLVPVDKAKSATKWYEEENNAKLKSGRARRMDFNTAGLDAGYNANLNRGVAGSANRARITA